MPNVNRAIFRWLFTAGATTDDFADRLNHIWTFVSIILLAAIISWKQEMSEPVNCWCPAEFTDSMVRYSNARCWNSYSIIYPDLRSIPIASYDDQFHPYVFTFSGLKKSNNAKTTYYQWVPLILIIQALFFKLPNIIFYVLHNYSGLSFVKIYGLTEGFHNMNIGDRSLLSKQLGRYLYVWCKASFLSDIPWRLLTFLTCIMKLLFCTNVICQLVFINSFLATKFVKSNLTSYGELIYDNFVRENATYWRESLTFPRIVHCDFSIRQLQNVQKYSVQCDLTVNNFSERIYMLLWIWLVMVTVATVASFLVWVLKTVIPIFRQRYVKKFLEMSEDQSYLCSGRDVNRFANSFVGEDGVVVLKLIAANSSDLIVKETVLQMWRMHFPYNQERHETQGQSGTYRQGHEVAMEQLRPSAPLLPQGESSGRPLADPPLYPDLKGPAVCFQT